MPVNVNGSCDLKLDHMKAVLPRRLWEIGLLRRLQSADVWTIDIFFSTCNIILSKHLVTVKRTCEFKLDPKSFIVGASENWSSPCLEVYRIILDMRFYRIPDNTGYRFAPDTGYPVVPDTQILVGYPVQPDIRYIPTIMQFTQNQILQTIQF